MAFRVGQKVRCIKKGLWTVDGTFPEYFRERETHPKDGDFLTVRSVNPLGDGYTYLRFDEVINPLIRRDEITGDDAECEFNSKEFRPIIDTSKEVEKLKQIAINPKVMA